MDKQQAPNSKNATKQAVTNVSYEVLTTLEKSNREKKEKEFCKQHIQALHDYASASEWQYTSYFLEKALESLTDLD